MSALQGWAFLLLLAGVAARWGSWPRPTPSELGTIGAAAALAIVQRVLIDQVALDEPIIAPAILALPIVVALRGDLRSGLMAAFGTWLALAVVAGLMPLPVTEEFPKEGFLMAALFAALLSGAAVSLPSSHKHLGPLLGLGWLAFFLLRDKSLIECASVWGVVILTVVWTFAGTKLLPSHEVTT